MKNREKKPQKNNKKNSLNSKALWKKCLYVGKGLPLHATVKN